MKNYVIINVEKTSFCQEPFDDSTIIKIEAVKIDENFNKLKKFSKHIKPSSEKQTSSKSSTTSLKEALEKFLEFTKDSWLICYPNSDVLSIIKGIYETKIEDHPINFVSLKEYIVNKTDICKTVKPSLENVANYYDIKFNSIEKEYLSIIIELLKILLEKENVKTIDEFINQNIPKFLLPGLSKKNTKVKVRFHQGKGNGKSRSIEFSDKTADRKVSYLTHYNAIKRYDTTFYELVLFKKWGAKIIYDFIYFNEDMLEFFDYYNIYSNIDLSKSKDQFLKIKENIPYLDKYAIKLGCTGTIEELTENYKELGENDLNKLISHIKIFSKKNS